MNSRKNNDLNRRRLAGNAVRGGRQQARGSAKDAKDVAQLVQLATSGDWRSVEAVARQMLVANPHYPLALGFLGQALCVQSRFMEGIAHLDAALKGLPDNLVFRGVRALAKVQSGDRLAAREEAGAVLAADPKSVVALKVLGMCALEDKANEEAEKFFRQAIEVAPHDPECLNLLGKLFVKTERDEEAKPWLKRSIKLNPRSAIPFYLLGSVYRHLCRFGTAYSFYRHAHRLDPEGQSTNVNLGVGLLDVGRLHEAIEVLQGYVDQHPDAADAHFNLSTALLQIGRLKDGWREYEWRKKTHQVDRQLPFPHWQGEPLAGKALLITAEQGVGDEIWAASMFDELVAEAAQVIIECEPRLVSLFQRSFPKALITPKQAGKILLPVGLTIDYQCAMLSIAQWRRDHESKFPGKVGYLVPDSTRQEFWRWRLRQMGDGLKVGIAWRSGMLTGVRKAAYSSLNDWENILSTPNLTFVNLQYGDCQAELDSAEERFGVKLHNFRDIDLKDGFEDVAALMGELDVIVAPAISVAVLGAALNVPVLKLVPHNNWTALGKDYDPWFPSVRFYFRSWDQDWQEAMRGVANELQRISRVKITQPISLLAEETDAGLKALLNRIGRGSILLNSGFKEKAQAIFEEILALIPDHAEATMWLGLCQKANGNLDDAEKSMRRAVELDDQYADAFNQLGILLLEKSALGEACEVFKHCLQLRPNYPDAMCNLGNAYFGTGLFLEAETCYRRTIAAMSGHSIARYNLAWVLESCGNYSAALTEYQTVIDVKPGYADAWNNLGRLYGKSGLRDEAISAYRKAIAADPRLSLARNNLAKNLLLVGELEEAIQLMDQLVVELPNDARLANNYGSALLMTGEREAAILQFQRAITLDPYYVDAYKNIANVMQQDGRLEEARELLSKAVAIFSEKQS